MAEEESNSISDNEQAASIKHPPTSLSCMRAHAMEWQLEPALAEMMQSHATRRC